MRSVKVFYNTKYRDPRQNLSTMTSGRYAAMVLESGYDNFCRNICLCTGNGECYTFSNGYGYVELVPYCTGKARPEPYLMPKLML